MAYARETLVAYLCADASVCGHEKGLTGQLTTRTVICSTLR
jgi:hypothetical protein